MDVTRHSLQSAWSVIPQHVYILMGKPCFLSVSNSYIPHSSLLSFFFLLFFWFIDVSAEEHGLRMEQHMVARLLSWCPPDGADWTAVYDGPLPWDT
jgi:hypothetical protein